MKLAYSFGGKMEINQANMKTYNPKCAIKEKVQGEKKVYKKLDLV